MDLNKYKLQETHHLESFRSSQNSIIVFSKNKYLNLAVYDAINNCLLKWY